MFGRKNGVRGAAIKRSKLQIPFCGEIKRISSIVIERKNLFIFTSAAPTIKGVINHLLLAQF